jgi:hypothetical protein
LTTPLNKNYWAETESLSAETDTSHLNKTKHRDRDFTCGAETVRIGYSAEMTSNQSKPLKNDLNRDLNHIRFKSTMILTTLVACGGNVLFDK